jgi:two-component system phosphate regulon sensor histidine kinase PhoR
LSQQNINALIERAATGVQLLLDEKNGKIHFDLQATNSDMKVDELHITNIIRNLLDNAIKYCDKVPEITITTTDSKKGITISVADNGIGINPSQKKQVFEKFYRIPTGNIHNVKGFGLGLYYVKSLVLAHQGTVNVESIESGSKFTLFLPYLK